MASTSNKSKQGEATESANTVPGGSAADSSASASVNREVPGAGNANFFDVMSMFNVMSSVSEEAKVYIDNVSRGLGEYKGMKVETVRLGEPNGAFAFISGNKAIILILSESVAAPSQPMFAPKARNSDLAMASLRKSHPNISVLESILVRPVDYGRAIQMTKHIGDNLFLTTTDQVPSNVNMLARSTNYTVDRNVDLVRQFTRQYSPHAADPRIDVGVMVYLSKPQNDQFVREGLIEHSTPVMSVGGYTEMIRQRDPATGLNKYLPIVRITNITTIVPIPGLALIGLALAAEHLCKARGWVDQFRVFDKRKPNLGNLIPDESGSKPYFAPNMEALDQIIYQNCYPAVLALDVVEGLARIPALINFIDQANGPQNLATYISNFFNGQNISMRGPVTTYTKSEYIGVYGDGAGIDTRKFTFLDVVANSAPTDQANSLLDWHSDPSTHAKMVSEWSGGYDSLYLSTTAVLSDAFLASLSQVIAGAGISLVSNTNMAMGNVNMSSLIETANNMMSLQGITSSPTSWNSYGMGNSRGYGNGFY